MPEIYITRDSFPKQKYTPGCTYIAHSKSEVEEMKKHAHFLVMDIYYVNRKWYEFWKINKVSSYELLCVK